MNNILIHHSVPANDKLAYYRKGKEYTYEEYSKLIYRKQLVKDVVFVTVVGVVMVFRAYVFCKYGI